MQISEFAHAVGLTTDTVRFYVKKKLLRPEVGFNRYHIFNSEDVEYARLINVAQLLGFTIRELVALRKERETKGLSNARFVEVLSDRLIALRAKAKEIDVLSSFVKTKIAWLEAGKIGPEPFLEQMDSRITARPADVANLLY
jgi:MerR family transcriptional regulator, copper efflux regulator